MSEHYRGPAPQPMSKEKLDAHCGKSGCMCNHTTCYRGWVDNQYTTTPCGMCRERLYTMIMTMPPPGERSPADQANLQSRGKAI